jgi:ribosomal protein L16/L10AE
MVTEEIRMIPISQVVRILQNYIHRITGEVVIFEVPIKEQHKEKFEQAFSQACADMNIQF